MPQNKIQRVLLTELLEEYKHKLAGLKKNNKKFVGFDTFVSESLEGIANELAFQVKETDYFTTNHQMEFCFVKVNSTFFIEIVIYGLIGVAADRLVEGLWSKFSDVPEPPI